MRKKVWSLVLSMALCLALLPVSVSALGGKQQVVLHVTVRDFKADGVLFEGRDRSSSGLVQEQLGADSKPVYDLAKWQQVYGDDVTQEMLDALYNNVPGVNMSTRKTLTLNADSDGYYVIDSSVDEMGDSSDGYFPIDDELFGNEGRNHNFHFSTELHAVFQYKPGDTFEFVGDDDLWAFFNGVLCVDLGGTHSPTRGTASIDRLVEDGTLDIKPGDYVYFDCFNMERHTTGSNMYIKTNIDFVNFENSDWATSEVLQAYEHDLMPARLMDADLSLPIDRDEFAAVAVKLYEAMSGKTATVGTDPFVDTDDPDVLKAYNVGIVNGISETEYAPHDKLTREQAATMLTRVLKAVSIPGWTLADDSRYPLDFTMPTPFGDDANISGWARESVYFMAANKILEGVGGNRFAPRNTTSQEESVGYANASRETAIIISVRSYNNLK